MIILVVLAHVRTLGPPLSSLFGSEPIPDGPRLELRNVYFPRVCARPRARPRAPARARARALSPTAFAVKGEEEEEGGSVPSSLSDSL